MELKFPKDSVQKLILLSFLSFLKQVFLITLAIIFLIGAPFLFTLVLPLFIYRYILGHLIQFFNPNFGKLLTARSTIFGQDDFHKYPKFTLITGSLLQGNLDFQTMKDSIRKNLIEKTQPNGELRFPELQQYIIKWGGFMFWKRDKEFNIDNHIELINNADRYDDADIKKIQQQLIEKPWVKGQPVWNFVLVNNYYPKNAKDSGARSVMFLRCHHCLLDGFAITSMLSEGLFGMTAEYVESELKSFMESLTFPKIPFWYYFAFPFLSAYDAASVCFKVFQPSPWRPKEKDQTGKFNLAIGPVVQLQALKNIKSHFGVSFSSVTTAVICGAIREMMLKKGVKVPESMLAAVALPLPRMHVKLRNIMTGSYASMPLTESDPIKRLQFCFEDYKRLKTSTIPLQTHWAFICMGSLPNTFCRLLSRNRYVPLVMSNFMAGTDHYYVCGHKMEEGLFAVGPQIGSVGLSFWQGSYVDMFRISVVSEASVLSPEETQDLASEIANQINIYSQFINV